MSGQSALLEQSDNVVAKSSNIDQSILLCNCTLGDYIWLDQNNNGIRDMNEPGIAGVQVVLRDITGMELAQSYTDDFGLYLFEGLCPGDYIIEVDATSLPPRLMPTTQIVRGDYTIDNDTIDSNGSPVTVTIFSENTQKKNIGFGYVFNGTISGSVWIDQNDNGIQDVDEPGIPGVQVFLINGTGQELAQSYTDDLGLYHFTDLFAGDYIVKVDMKTLPSGLRPFIQDTENDTTDIPDDPVLEVLAIQENNSPSLDTFVWEPVLLYVGNDYNVTVDFVFIVVCNGTIGGYVWKDLNNNGIQDSKETGIPGVRLKVEDDEYRRVVPKQTDDTGFYMCNHLCPDNYRVSIDETTLPIWMVCKASSVLVTIHDVDDQNLNISFGYYLV